MEAGDIKASPVLTWVIRGINWLLIGFVLLMVAVMVVGFWIGAVHQLRQPLVSGGETASRVATCSVLLVGSGMLIVGVLMIVRLARWIIWPKAKIPQKPAAPLTESHVSNFASVFAFSAAVICYHLLPMQLPGFLQGAPLVAAMWQRGLLAIILYFILKRSLMALVLRVLKRERLVPDAVA